MKKITQFITATFIIIALLTLHASSALEKDESWYQSVCFNAETAVQNKEACKEYVAYLAEQAQNAYDNANAIQTDLEDIRANIKQAIEDRRKYEAQIIEIRARIAQVESLITIKEEEIAYQEALILEKEEEIAELDAFVKELMRYQQDTSYFNSYVEFVMDADSLVDLLLRISALEDIGTYNEKTLNQLKTLVAELEAIKAQLIQDKEDLEAFRAQIKVEESTVKVLLDKAAVIEKEYLAIEAELEAEQNKWYSEVDALQVILNNVALDDIKTTLGWTKPIASGYRVTATAWNYPASFGGGIHLGVDYAAPIGTTIQAAGNGVIIASANACATVGYLGSSCGYPGTGGGGNQAHLLTSINGRLYVVKYLHMKKDTVIKPGTTVSAGDKIGEVGSSGNSTGSHVHVEIFYLGTGSISDYAKSWKGDLSFGANWGSAALKNRCESNGNTPPCRIKPQDIFGE